LICHAGLHRARANATVDLILTVPTLVLGNSEHSFAMWDTTSVQFKNAFRYFALRACRQMEGRVKGSQYQTGVMCMCITGTRALYLSLGMDPDDDVKYIEQRGGQLFGELGSAFKLAGRQGKPGRTNFVAPKFRFVVTEPKLVLSSSTAQELPTVPVHGRVPDGKRFEVSEPLFLTQQSDPIQHQQP